MGDWEPKPGDWVVAELPRHAFRMVAQVVSVEDPGVHSGVVLDRGLTMDRPWPIWGGGATRALLTWCRPATPEELARVQLDQLGAEDAL